MKDNFQNLKQNLKIEGNRIRLVSFTEKHLHDSHYLSWLHDYDVIKYLNLPSYLAHKVSFDEVKAYVESALRSDNLLFLAMETSEGKFIGTFKIGPIDWHAKNVNLGVLIGDRASWGKGICTEAFEMAIKFCFEELEMHKIVGGCMEPNSGMRRVFEKFGFVVEGRFREQDFLEGKWCDHLHFGLLKKEWDGKALSQK